MVGVAKWLRHWTVTPVFAGSNPVAHPSILPKIVNIGTLNNYFNNFSNTTYC